MRLAIRSLSRRCRHLSTHASSTRYTSANPDEIAHFSRLSAHWWDERGEFALLHKMNPVRMKFIQDKLLETARHDDMEDSGYLRGKEVLDIGCGGGLLSEVLNSQKIRGPTLTLLTPSESHASRSAHAWGRRFAVKHRHCNASRFSRPKSFLTDLPTHHRRSAIGSAPIRCGVRNGGHRTRRKPAGIPANMRTARQGTPLSCMPLS